MSKISVYELQCTNCKRELKVNMYHSINNVLDYGLREKLLNNELTDIVCDCGHVMKLRYPILYHKMDILKSVMIQYTQSDIEEVKKQHNTSTQYMNRICNLNGTLRDDIFEVYNDWDTFIERIKEIG